MAKKDKWIDESISKAEAFAKPILKRLRAIVHKACPEVEETIKWGFPHFLYAGKILCSMASFKEHCAFGFRLGSVMKDPHRLLKTVGTNSGMGHFGKIMSMKDLPSEEIMVEYIRQAMALTDQGVSKKQSRSIDAREIKVPAYFIKVLKKDSLAYETFTKFSYSHKKEYVEWITEAKTEETRNRRMATAVEWLREGKGRNWKYVK